MAGNRTELVLSMITEAVENLEEGMRESCKNIQDSLTMRNTDLEARWERECKPVGGCTKVINLDYLRPSSSPLLEEYSAHKKLYAKAVAINIEAHYGYACLALKKILQSFKWALLSTRGLEDGGVVSSDFLRPHALGGVEPPSASAVAAAIRDRFKALNMMDKLDTCIIAKTLETINNEREVFDKENAINNAFEVSYASTPEAVAAETNFSGVVVLPPFPSEQDREASNNNLTAVVKRPADQGVDWRPKTEEGETVQFPYENIWGDNNIGVKTLSILYTDVVIPHIFLANFVLYMCHHMRAVIRSVKAILYNDTETPGGYFEDNRTICSWIDLYNKLEWFMLVSRLVCFFFSKKEEFLNVTGASSSPAANEQQNSLQRLLAAALESIPPNLLSDEWVAQNLLSWKPSQQPPLPPSLAVTEDNLLRIAVRTGPTAVHHILGEVNEGGATITNRISSQSAAFCVQILLGRALDEENSGIKMLVSKPDDDHDSDGNDKKDKKGGYPNYRMGEPVVGLLPAETLTAKQDETTTPVVGGQKCYDNNSKSPFLTNPTYFFKKIWDLETGGSIISSEIKRENDAIPATLLKHLSPMAFISTVPGVNADKAWISIKLLPCCKAPEAIRNLWSAINQQPYDGGDKLFAKLKTTSEKQCEQTKQSLKRKRDASSHLATITNDLSNIQKSNKTCSVATEHALWTTSIWKKTTQACLTLLSSFPDNL